eukprot:CAMPEP_0197029136 /NCGR_PEP_ID=MMETSP1384-20130603/8644_1 /TAXON_ID=29189 /ORGANISM="Ammonia sp." /LENGTH=626 /DNA_ID=CAMNT_0042458241 /DNA_START=44 /DNA_END=1924 /DNA_ORIENTATION=-
MASSMYALLVFINHHAGLLAVSVIVATIILLVFKAWYQNKLHPFHFFETSPEPSPECNVTTQPHNKPAFHHLLPSSNDVSIFKHYDYNDPLQPIKAIKVKHSTMPKQPALPPLPASQPSVTTISNAMQLPYPCKVFYPKAAKPANKQLDVQPVKLPPKPLENAKLDANLQQMYTEEKHEPFLIIPSVPKAIPAMNKKQNDEQHQQNHRLSEKLNSIREYSQYQESKQEHHDHSKNSNSIHDELPAANLPHIGSPTQHLEHMQQIQSELDQTSYPQYLDGYHTLNTEQKKFLNAIKQGDMATIQRMSSYQDAIKSNINFNESQVIRDCVLENRLEILKYLKQKFANDIDLNCENGYCLRWSARKGFYEIVHYLLCEQKYQRIDCSPFQYQAIEWAIIYKHRQIAKLIQKYYNESKLSEKWNILSQSQKNLGVEFDIFNLPSIYQEIIEKIINVDDVETNQENIDCIRQYFQNGCDLKFENCMAWTVAVDCTNMAMLQFLFKEVGVDPLCLDAYLLRTACDMRSIELLQFAKTIISWEMWKCHVEPQLSELKAICSNDPVFVRELENYHRAITPIKKKKGASRINEWELPQSPIPWPYESPHVRQKYGILTRSKRKILVKKGVLQPIL